MKSEDNKNPIKTFEEKVHDIKSKYLQDSEEQKESLEIEKMQDLYMKNEQ